MDLSFLNYDVHRLKDTPFAIITDNCWGFHIYQTLKRPYNTPFVGLYLYPDCYLRLLENFDRLFTHEITFSKESHHFDSPPAHPVGKLWDDIEIHFLHYDSVEEAKEKWTRRTERLAAAIAGGTPLVYKMCDNWKATPEHFQRFHQLPRVAQNTNISFNYQGFQHPNTLHAIRKGEQLNGLRLFRKRYQYFNFSEWILTGKITSPPLLPRLASYFH
ncbi:MAG: DUF1919 domain-containing protein [Verrucomicrobiaceae bacterium]